MNKTEIKLRIKFWKAVLKHLQRKMKVRNSLVCFCWAIDDVRRQEQFYDYSLSHYMKKGYPELWKYKPNSGWRRNSAYWWSPETSLPQTKRFEVINNIINDFEQQLKN